MTMTLRTERIRTLDDIRAFLAVNDAADITPHDREAAYALVAEQLGQILLRWTPDDTRVW